MYSNRLINQSINEEITYVGLPTKARFILTWIGVTNSIVLELWEKNILAYIKSREIEDIWKPEWN